jgi:cysteine desulfurase/selenocysteine lyase
MGIGFLYARAELLEAMPPFLLGGDMISSVSLHLAKWNEIPWKFEAGTPNVEGAVGLAAAIGYLKDVGMRNVSTRQAGLTGYALKRLSEYPYVKAFGPKQAARRPGVVSFEVRGVHPHDVAEILDGEAVAVRAGYHCAQPLVESLSSKPTVRASFYIYNTQAEVDRLCAGIEKAAKLFGIRD